MTNTDRPFDLEEFGPRIASYAGEGEIRDRSGAATPCTFEAAQLRHGDVVCLTQLHTGGMWHVRSATMMSGTTSDGRAVSCSGAPLTFSTHHSSNGPPAQATSFRFLDVRRPDADLPRQVRYGITNFHFSGTSLWNDRGSEVLVLPVTLASGSGGRSIRIVPLPDYRKVELRQSRLKVATVTAEVVFELREGERPAGTEDAVEDLCHILSVARGTGVQWLYRWEVSADGKEVGRTHFDRVVKDYSSLPAIDPRAGGRHETLQFIETAFPKYQEHRERFQLARGAIASMVDAKLEGDYLEMRGAKAAVAVELLKAAYLDSLDSPLHEYCILPERYEGELVRELNRAVKDVLNKRGVAPRSVRESIADVSKLQGLNRRSFASILREMCRFVALDVSREDINLFVKCRNSLVHRGRFYCETATEADRQRCKPKAGPWEEYCFVIEFIDRFFLRMLGYSGFYFDPFTNRRKWIGPPGATGPAAADSEF